MPKFQRSITPLKFYGIYTEGTQIEYTSSLIIVSNIKAVAQICFSQQFISLIVSRYLANNVKMPKISSNFIKCSKVI